MRLEEKDKELLLFRGRNDVTENRRLNRGLRNKV